MEQKRSANLRSRQRLPLVFLCAVALLTVIIFSPVMPISAHHVEFRHNSSCGGYAFKTEYIGGKGEFKVVWDMHITVDGVTEAYKGEKELVNTSRFLIFDIKKPASSAYEKGYIELFQKDASGIYKSIQKKEYDTAVQIETCPTPTPELVITPTAIPTPTITITVERGDAKEDVPSARTISENTESESAVVQTPTPTVTPSQITHLTSDQVTPTAGQSAESAPTPTATPAQLAQVYSTQPSQSSSNSTSSDTVSQQSVSSDSQKAGQVSGVSTSFAPTGTASETVKRILASTLIITMLFSKELKSVFSRYTFDAKKRQLIHK